MSHYQEQLDIEDAEIQRRPNRYVTTERDGRVYSLSRVNLALYFEVAEGGRERETWEHLMPAGVAEELRGLMRAEDEGRA